MSRGDDAPPCGTPFAAGSSRESRCVCGSLLARLTAQGVELKCRRCKRIVLVRWEGGRRGARALPGGPRDPP
jgi:hypothetical protein